MAHGMVSMPELFFLKLISIMMMADVSGKIKRQVTVNIIFKFHFI